MRIDKEIIRYLTSEDTRILVSIQQGMKNHEIVPVPLIETIASLKRSDTFAILIKLLKYKFIHHDNSKYDGYYLSRQGYDVLAITTFLKRGLVTELGSMIGIGKESDIYICRGPVPKEEDEKKEEESEQFEQQQPRPMRTMVLKLARLGRVSFRAVKQKRDYLKNRTASNWLYLSRLASMKEYGFMKVLHARNFPIPEPIDWNRHAVLMEHIDAVPMRNVSEMAHPVKVYQGLIELILKLAEHGLIHGDFNEFNLMINEEEKITLIDFPQMVSIHHPHAEEFFDRDIRSIQHYFKNKMGITFDSSPSFTKDVEQRVSLDLEMKASGFQLSSEAQSQLLKAIGQQKENQSQDQEEEQSSEEEEDTNAQTLQENGISQAPVQSEGTKQSQGHSTEPSSQTQEREEEKEIKTSKKKTVLVINPQYVKERVKQQFKRENFKKKQTRNKNKDKKIMKARAEVQDQLY